MTKNLIGMVFGWWTVVRFHSKNNKRQFFWLCKCQCGREIPVNSQSLVRGISTKCRRHGVPKREDVQRPEYSVWKGMKDRCNNLNSTYFHHYGGRGIKICEEWNKSFKPFFSSMGTRPTPKHTLERKNTNGNYEPSNCIWATRKDQCRNTRRNRFISFGGETKLLCDWARQLGIHHSSLFIRLSKWPLDVALTLPKQENRYDRQRGLVSVDDKSC